MMRRLAILLLTAVLLLLAGCERQPAIQPSGDVVRLAIVGPFSGADAAKGQEGMKGMQVAIGLDPLLDNGDAVELVAVDDQNRPEITVDAIAKLAADESVAAIVLMSTSASALAAGAKADALEMPVLATIATHTRVAKDHRYISQLCFDNAFQGSVAALFARDELLLDKAGVIRDARNQYSTQLADEFIDKFRTTGGTITGIRALEPASGGYAKVLQELRNRGTELLYLPVGAEEVIRIEKALDQIDWSPLVMSGDGTLASAVTQYPQDTGFLEGMYATDFFSYDMPWTRYGEKARRALIARFAETGTTYSALGAEAYLVLNKALNRCGKHVDRECTNRMIRSTRNLEGLAGMLSITREGKAERALVVNTVQDGRMRFVVKVY